MNIYKFIEVHLLGKLGICDPHFGPIHVIKILYLT